RRTRRDLQHGRARGRDAEAGVARRLRPREGDAPARRGRRHARALRAAALLLRAGLRRGEVGVDSVLLLACAGVAALVAPAPQTPPAPSVVARLELGAPSPSPFVFHATLPIPKGVYPRADGKTPFALRSGGPETELVPLQVEVVSRYPTGEADVVEL